MLANQTATRGHTPVLRHSTPERLLSSPVLAEAEVEDPPRVRRELGADAPVPTRLGTERVEQRVRHPPPLRHGVRRDDAAVSHRHPFVFVAVFALYSVII